MATICPKWMEWMIGVRMEWMIVDDWGQAPLNVFGRDDWGQAPEYAVREMNDFGVRPRNTTSVAMLA
jgi:hypothetical protein